MNAKPQSVNEHRIESALPPVKTSEKYLKLTTNFVTFGIMPTLQRLSRGRSQKIHIGAFAFSDEKQRNLFKDIIVKEPILVDNDALIGTVERIAQVKTSSTMHKHERLNGHKLNVKISEDPNSESSITFHDKKRRGVVFDRDASDEITLHLKPGAPAETEALLYIAEQTALRGNFQKLMLNDNFQSWVQGEDGSPELKNALLNVQVANDPEKAGKYRVSSKTQQQSVEQQGQSTDNNDQITSLPKVEDRELQAPLSSNPYFKPFLSGRPLERVSDNAPFNPQESQGERPRPLDITKVLKSARQTPAERARNVKSWVSNHISLRGPRQ